MSRILRGALHTTTLTSVLNDGAPLMLVGPPGVGKTLALVKLAAQCLMENRPVKIISTDRQKSGGCAQIESLSEAIGAELAVIENPTLLHRAMEENRSQHLLLIDTPGTNPFDASERERLHKMVQASNATVILVLPAWGDQEYFEEIEQAFKVFNTQFLFITQLDLTQRLGHVISRALDGQDSLLAVGLMPEVAHLMVTLNSLAFTNLIIDRYDDFIQQNLFERQLRIAM